ncbi:hypothetical protein [Novosphingobium sp. ST904]|uniref:hypothetical protein n=1 Tax=Novosphingobium sp. ST904 TaxID=1684385 RepID=UPI000A8564F0|nr:hypothetical protein [Novosphingobium sp. ST904]
MSPSKALSSHVQLALVIIVVLGLALVIDITIPLGTGVSVLYLLPTVIAFVARRPITPVLAAIAGVGCAIAAYFIAPQGLGLEIALTNRAFSGVTNFLLAAIGFVLIRYRNSNRHEQWLRECEADLARATAGSIPLGDLGDRALAFLAERFGAIAGALYATTTARSGRSRHMACPPMQASRNAWSPARVYWAKSCATAAPPRSRKFPQATSRSAPLSASPRPLVSSSAHSGG